MALPLIKLGPRRGGGVLSLLELHAPRAAGSTTNASDAVDDIDLPANPTVEQKLDAGVQETFPASDPVSITQPSETAYEAAQRRKRSS